MTANEILVDPAWLAERLAAAPSPDRGAGPAVLALDCRVRRVPQPSGPSLWQSCREDWLQAHIPGAGYAHMVEDLSDPDHPVPFMLPPPARIAALLGRFGVRPGTILVVHGEGADMAAHRAWWVLRASGWPDVGVLDGGLRRWRAEGRPLEAGLPDFHPAPPPALQPRPGLVADRAAVAQAIGDPATCLANALPEEVFRGAGGQVYGRPGRIPGSVSLPADALVDPATGCFRPAAELAALFAARIPPQARRVIPYCGGGIAASTLAVALAIAGRDDVRLYDGSLLDWTLDPDAPMDTG